MGEWVNIPLYAAHQTEDCSDHACSVCGVKFNVGDNFFFSFEHDLKTGFPLNYCKECVDRMKKSTQHITTQKTLDSGKWIEIE